MRTERENALAVAVLVLIPVVSSCAASGSSFETLGVPAVRDYSDRGALIIGWAREARSGWRLEELTVDEEIRDEWSGRAQTPAVVHLAPGDHKLQISAVRQGQPGSSPRRYKVRPLAFPILAEEVRLCVVSLSRRDRPTVTCPHYTGPRSKRQPRQTSGEPAARAEQGGGELAAILERLERIERRLAAMTEGSEETPEPTKATAPDLHRRFGTRLEIDREFPVEGEASKTSSTEPRRRELKKISIPENSW